MMDKFLAPTSAATWKAGRRDCYGRVSLNNLRSRLPFTDIDATVASPRAAALRRHALYMLALLPLFVLAFYVAYWLRFEGHLSEQKLADFRATVYWVVGVKLVLFGWFRVYRGWSRYVSFYDMVALIQVTTGSMTASVLIDRFLLPLPRIPRSVYLIDWGVTIAMVGGILGLVRLFQERNWLMLFSRKRVPAFIVGANEAGESLLRAIDRNNRLPYRVVGFIDDDPSRIGARILGVPVLGAVAQTCDLAMRHGVSEVLIAAGRLSGRQTRQLVDEGQQCGVRMKVLPTYEQLLRGTVAVRPRDVVIDDLLRRDPVELDLADIRQWIDDRVLLVTGSAGSIGSEICRQLLKFAPKRIVMVDRSETGQFFLERELAPLARDSDVPIDVILADLLDESRLRTVLDEYRPDIIFHAAAYKHVPLMEHHPGEAVKNIVGATRRLADLAIEHGVKSFVMISTDKAVNPTSVMGCCKRVAELYVQSLTDWSPCKFVTVRFGNVLDSAGSVVQVFRNQIAAGGPITVTDPRMQRFFMTIPEAARLVVQAGAIGRGGEILVLDMGDPVRIVDLAADMVRLSGLRLGQDVEIEFVGLRPGEKLYEELQASGETRLPTRHPKITIAQHKRRDPAFLHASVELLEGLANGAAPPIVSQLRQIVPEFQRVTPDSADRRAAA